jgi:hypothetical protein
LFEVLALVFVTPENDMRFLRSVRGWFVALVARARTAADIGFFISRTSPVDSAWQALAIDMEAGTVRVIGKAADHFTTGAVDGSGALTPSAVPASHSTFDGATVLVKAPNGRAVQATAHFMAATGGAQPAIPMGAPKPGTVFPGAVVDYLGDVQDSGGGTLSVFLTGNIVWLP